MIVHNVKPVAGVLALRPVGRIGATVGIETLHSRSVSYFQVQRRRCRLLPCVLRANVEQARSRPPCRCRSEPPAGRNGSFVHRARSLGQTGEGRDAICAVLSECEGALATFSSDARARPEKPSAAGASCEMVTAAARGRHTSAKCCASTASSRARAGGSATGMTFRRRNSPARNVPAGPAGQVGVGGGNQADVVMIVVRRQGARNRVPQTRAACACSRARYPLAKNSVHWGVPGGPGGWRWRR